MRKCLAVTLFTLFGISAFGQGTQWFKGSFDEALEKAGSENKMVVVYFYSDMRGGCRLLGQQFFG